MRKTLVLMSLMAATAMWGADTPSAELRAFYMHRDFDNTAPITQSMNVGGIVKYSKEFDKAKVNLGYYGSYQLQGYTDQEAIGTSLVKSNGQNIAFLGEANIQAYGFTIGRQRLSTPLMNDHDLRMLPSVYQGITYNTALPYGFNGQIGYITKYSGFGSKYSGFSNENSKWGDRGLSYVHVSGNGMNAQWVHTNDAAHDIPITDFGYADYQFNIGSVYVKPQAGFNNYKNQKNSTMVGIKVGTKISVVDVAILGNQITGNRWKAIESGAMFTDLQQGYGDYDQSQSIGAAVGGAIGSLDARFTMARVVSLYVDDYNEMQADLTYQIVKDHKVRVRYSVKDQTPESHRADRNDFRVIYYWSF